MTRPDESQANDSGVLTGGASAAGGPSTGGFTQIGRYKILRELGRGAMGVVYEAVDPKIGRKVALKVLHDVPGIGEAELEEFRSRFFREARTAGMLSHPNIVVIHDVDSDERLGISFMAMECLKGQTVYDLLRSGVKFTTDQSVDICIQVAEGLDHAHRQGVVHRDVKPANLMMMEDGSVKITDFGIAKISTSNLTRTGQFLGTPNYMSPEQVIGHVIDGRSDLFSLGIIVYELLTGEKPFMGSSLTTITYQIVNVDPIEPSKIRPGLAKRYDAIVAKMLKKAPDERYQTGKEVAEALRQARDGQSPDAVAAAAAAAAAGQATMISAGDATHVAVGGPGTMHASTAHGLGHAGAPTLAHAPPSPRRPWGLVGGVAALVIAAAAAAAWFASRGGEPAPAATGPAAATAASATAPSGTTGVAAATAPATTSPAAATAAAATAPAGATTAEATAPAGATSAATAPAGRTAPAASTAPRVADARPTGPRGTAPALATDSSGRPVLVAPEAALLGARPSATGPATAAADRPGAGTATVNLILQHKLKDGTVTVTVGGKQVFSADVASENKRRKDTVTASFKVPDGRHEVRVCISSPDMQGGPLCNTKAFSFVMNRTATIRAEHFKPPLAPHKFSASIE